MPDFAVQIVPVTAFQQNCSICFVPSTKRGVVVDPGGDLPVIREAIRESGVTVEAIWLTHGHIDHAAGAAELARELGVEIVGPHVADKPLLDRLEDQGRSYGIEGAQNVTPDRWLVEGDRVEIGAIGFDILHCPGHSPGSVVFHSAELGFCLMGDVLFAGSVGRTDLPGGSHETLIAAIRDKIFPLGDDTQFLPGHGPGSTVGQERLTNPFLQA